MRPSARPSRPNRQAPGVRCEAPSARTAGRPVGFGIASTLSSRGGWTARSEMHPVPEAGPGLAVETVALDRNLPGDDGIEHALAGVLEAALVDDAARRRVDDPGRGVQHLDRRAGE